MDGWHWLFSLFLLYLSFTCSLCFILFCICFIKFYRHEFLTYFCYWLRFDWSFCKIWRLSWMLGSCNLDYMLSPKISFFTLLLCQISKARSYIYKYIYIIVITIYVRNMYIRYHLSSSYFICWYSYISVLETL